MVWCSRCSVGLSIGQRSSYTLSARTRLSPSLYILLARFFEHRLTRIHLFSLSEPTISFPPHLYSYSSPPAQPPARNASSELWRRAATATADLTYPTTHSMSGQPPAAPPAASNRAPAAAPQRARGQQPAVQAAGQLSAGPRLSWRVVPANTAAVPANSAAAPATFSFSRGATGLAGRSSQPAPAGATQTSGARPRVSAGSLPGAASGPFTSNTRVSARGASAVRAAAAGASAAGQIVKLNLSEANPYLAPYSSVQLDSGSRKRRPPPSDAEPLCRVTSSRVPQG